MMESRGGGGAATQLTLFLSQFLDTFVPLFLTSNSPSPFLSSRSTPLLFYFIFSLSL